MMILWQSKFPAITSGGSRFPSIGKTLSPALAFSSYSLPLLERPLRYAVLGAGFAGLSVVWHLLERSPVELQLCIDVFDDVGIGGGASGVSGGLLHPYSPKVKPLWRGAECWEESLRLLSIAEPAEASKELTINSAEVARDSNRFIVRRRGILRPVVSLKNMDVMNDNAQNCLASCRIESINEDAARNLVPNLFVPLNSAFYMPDAVNVHPQRYLEALYKACESLSNDVSSSHIGGKMLHFHKRPVTNLLELAGDYDAVIVCLGARSAFLLELSGRLPLRTCRGVTAHMHLPDGIREGYPEHSPSILSDAWLAVQSPRSLYMGSTWEWKSTNYSQNVPIEEATKALEELLPKASAIYPSIQKWAFSGASAGLRGMPPITANGSLPLLGCIDDLIGGRHACKFWLFTGLGSRGLLYHAWLGKLMAQAVLSCNEEEITSELTSWRSKAKY